MKNTFKLLGIIAIAAVIGFSMAACSSDGSSSTTYMGMGFEIAQKDFEKAMNKLGLSTNPNDLINLPYADAEAAATELETHAIPPVDGDDNLSMSDITSWLQSTGMVNSAEISTITGKLGSTGFVLAGKNLGGGIYGIVAAMKE